MNTPPPEDHIRDSLRTGERVEQLLSEHMHEKTDASSHTPPVDWRQLVFDIGLVIVFLLVALWGLSIDLERFGLLGLTSIAEAMVRGVVLLALFFLYIRLRSAVLDMLFPQITREVVKTIYSIAPEMLEIPEQNELRLLKSHKSRILNYSLLTGFTLLLALFFLLHPRFISTVFSLLEEESLGALMIRIMIAAFVLAIYLTLRQLLSVHREYTHVHEMLWKIHKLGDITDGLNFFDLIAPNNTDSLIAEQLHVLRSIYLNRQRIDMSDLQSTAFIHMGVSSTILRYLISSMPILGLIGTILGLTISIGGLEGVLQYAATDKEIFTQSIGTSMEGIGTAFYTTLAGTISMLVLKFYGLIAQNAQRNFFVDMRNVLAVEVLPRLQRDTSLSVSSSST